MASLAGGGAALAQAVRAAYAAGQSDYGMEPLVLVDGRGAPVGPVRDGDAVVFCCRRGEREVQLTEAFVEPGFRHFPRRALRDLTFVILTLYHDKFVHLPVAFAPAEVGETLGEVVSRAGLRQLRVAESEKAAHITYFLNGCHAQPFPGQDDVRVPSLHGVAWEDAPEMSLPLVADRVIAGLQEGYALIAANVANGDVIGHTASHPGKIACAAAIDRHLGRMVGAAVAAGYVVLVTADHGNLEVMARPDGGPHVAHTASPVPLVLIDARAPAPALLVSGSLADVAPTVLHALGLAVPAAMTGRTLAPGHAWGARRMLLLILDGWGCGAADEGNPIHLASTPVWDGLLAHHPHTRLLAAGPAVGLEAGKPGNSEAGHLNIGAGRVVVQDDVRLDQALQDGSFAANPVLRSALDGVRRRGAALHLLGLLSERSSHGSIAYPLAILRMAREAGVRRAWLHLILDGRSTAPGSAPAMLAALDARLAEIGLGQVASAVGRGLALDRDGDYDKTRRAYEAMVLGRGRPCQLT